MLTQIRNSIVDIFHIVGHAWLVSWETLSPIAIGILLQLFFIVLIIICYRLFKNGKFGLLFNMFVEKVYEFFEEILEESGKRWIKVYVVTLFFVILISNLSSFLLDIVRMIFVDIEWLSGFVEIPTASFEFNIALATISILLFLFAQWKHLGILKFLHEYIPITGKGILDIKKDDVKSVIVYWPAKILIKVFDILISLFVGILDIIGIFAKVISLAARLYGNMIAGGILLTILVVGINSITQNLGGINFPIIAPLLLYLQSLLIITIQAFVFPLLVGIFMKLAQTSDT